MQVSGNECNECNECTAGDDDWALHRCMCTECQRKLVALWANSATSAGLSPADLVRLGKRIRQLNAAGVAHMGRSLEEDTLVLRALRIAYNRAGGA